jgi:hypothetical protein
MRAFAVGVILVALFAGQPHGQDRAVPETTLIFVDDLHIDFTATLVLRSQLSQAIERLLTAGQAVGLAADAKAGIWVQPTTDRASLLAVIPSVIGRRLKQRELQNPTSEMAAEISRRRDAAQRALLDSVTTSTPDVLLYITEAQLQGRPSGVWVRMAVTTPRDLLTDIARLMSRVEL